MNILVAGAGPAGLYFSYLAKRRHPDWRIRVLEQNPADATFGFGVVFSDKALEFLRADDAATYELITPQMETWTDLTVVHRGERVIIDGIGFSAIGRLHLVTDLAVSPSLELRAVSGETMRAHALAVLSELLGEEPERLPDLPRPVDALREWIKRGRK